MPPASQPNTRIVYTCDKYIMRHILCTHRISQSVSFCEFDKLLWGFILPDKVGDDDGEYELYSVDDSVRPVFVCEQGGAA